MTLRALLRQRRAAAVFVLLWAGASLLAAWRVALQFPGFPLMDALLAGVLDEMSWALVCLGCFAVAWRVDLWSGSRGRGVALLVVAGAAIILARIAAVDAVLYLWKGLRFVPPLADELLAAGMSHAVVVAAFFGTGYALEFFGRYRERELAASRLESRLAQEHLQLLKTQLQPHFLFDTFAVVSRLMYTDPQAANRLLTRLSDVLRLALYRSATQEVTLREELDGLQPYLEVERMRLNGRLEVRVEAPPGVLGARVPHLLLQPLVENAVGHGVSRRPGAGAVVIAARAEGGALRLEVRDDGPGFAPGWREGPGLAATRERLERLYGDEQALEAGPAPGGGARVALRLPLRLEGGREAPDGAAAAPGVPA